MFFLGVLEKDMGRIKTMFIKRTAIKLFNENRSKFKKTFEENKKIVDKLAEIESKKIRNVIAGYITRLANSDNDLTLGKK